MAKYPTPKPWRRDGTHVIGPDNQVVAVCRQAKPRNTCEAMDNAEEIVRACNSFGRLTAACADLLKYENAIMKTEPPDTDVEGFADAWDVMQEIGRQEIKQ